MIKLDENNIGGDFTPITPGEYEVFPVAFEVSTSQAGNPRIQFNYVIRDDVEQEFKGRELRYDNFTVTDNAMWRINQASKAAGLDMSKDFATPEDWAQEFKNKAIRVTVGQRTYNGKTYPEVKGFKPSGVGGVRVENAPTIDISDDDLPF
jgi:hypothetical protein